MRYVTDPIARGTASGAVQRLGSVPNLAKELKQFEDDGVVVFGKSDETNRDAFGLNELLYDICVCQTAECISYRGTTPLKYITKCLWQVESEFARNSAEAVMDFNKLVIGRADNKLFVGPRLGAQDKEERFLDTLRPVARCCVGQPPCNVYVALVPHPRDWNENAAEPALWQLVEDQWQPVG